MAAGPVLLWMLWLWSSPLPEPGMSQEDDEALVSAPPELLALVPAAAKATVAAGYTNNSAEEMITMPHFTEAPGLRVSLQAAEAAQSQEVTAEKETVLIVGDTRYAWQEWSEWHCNCQEGSMSRVRDITYAVPGVRLDPVQYDVLRFQREVCSYRVCDCSRRDHQCDRLEVTCDKAPVHMCALRDIEQDQDRKRKEFWGRVYQELKNLWQSLKDTFPQK